MDGNDDEAAQAPGQKPPTPAELRARAEAGDPAAQTSWARLLLYGDKDSGVQRDRNQALRLFRRAARKGHAESGYELGLAIVHSRNLTERNAIPWFVLAYRNGDAKIRRQAAEQLGRLYGGPLEIDPMGGPSLRSIPGSLVWYRRAARLGSETAKLHLIETYRLGNGVLRNDDKAKPWFAEVFGPDEPFSGGTPSIVSTLGKVRRVHPWRDLRQEAAQRDETVAKAVRTIREAESEESVRQAMDELEKLCRNGFAPAIAAWVEEIADTQQWNRWREAKTYLLDAVRQGHPDSLVLAGRWLLTGGLGVEQDIPRARALLDRAAKAGSVSALVELGDCARRGLGEPKDVEKAKRLVERAGEMGNGRGWFLRSIMEVSWNEAVASGLLRKAAELGNVYGCRRLGGCYRTGTGVSANDGESEVWLRKAAVRGYPAGQYEYGLLLDKLDRYGEAVLWLERALMGGMPNAGVGLGYFRLRGMIQLGGTKQPGRSCVLRDWSAAEHLFRRYCPCSKNLGLSRLVLEHFWSKPETCRTDRDRRFLEWFKREALSTDPGRWADVFREKDPAFARLCAEEAGKRKKGNPFEETFRRFAETAAKAEDDWNSVDKVLRRESGKSFMELAKEASKRAFSSGFERYLDNKNRPLNARPDEDRILLARCFWRAAQASFRKNDLPKDAKIRIGNWILRALDPFSYLKIRLKKIDPPPFVRDAASFAWKNAKQYGLSERDAKNACQIATELGDKEALLRMAERTTFSPWLSRAVDAGIPAAMRIKADRILAEGDANPTKKEWAEELLRKAADGGDPEAQCRLGEKLRDKAALDNDRRRAVAWFGKAAENGYGRAMLLLGRCLLEGFGTERNAERALEWFEKAVVSKSDDPAIQAEANFEAGRLLLDSGNTRMAVWRLKAAADKDHRAAMAVLALDPRMNDAIPNDDIVAWCNVLRKITDFGTADGRRLLGRVFTRLGRTPLGIQTPAKRLPWRAHLFRQAAEAGDGPGAYEYARCLLFGDGVPQDRRAAMQWLREAERLCGGLPGDDGRLAAFAGAWLKTSLFD